MTHRTVGYALGTLGLAAVLAAGCAVSTKDKCPGQEPSLVGTYDLLAYSKAGTSYLAPAATGVLRLHADSYGLAILLPGPTAVSDTGTYRVCGVSGFQQSSLGGRAEFSGIYILSGDTLSLSGQSAGSVWLLRP